MVSKKAYYQSRWQEKSRRKHNDSGTKGENNWGKWKTWTIQLQNSYKWEKLKISDSETGDTRHRPAKPPGAGKEWDAKTQKPRDSLLLRTPQIASKKMQTAAFLAPACDESETNKLQNHRNTPSRVPQTAKKKTRRIYTKTTKHRDTQKPRIYELTRFQLSFNWTDWVHGAPNPSQQHQHIKTCKKQNRIQRRSSRRRQEK